MTDLREPTYDEDLAPAALPARSPRLRYNPKDMRGDDVFVAAERNSRRVRILRFVLPAVAIGAIVVFWASARFAPGEMDSLVQSSGIDTTSNSVVMQSPHISGFEGTRRSYEVKAATAVQGLDDPKIVTFNEITGRFGLDDAGEAHLDAAKGVYDGNRNTLDLSGGVTVTTTSGYSGRLEGAAVDLGAGTLVSDQPLELKTAEGSIRANSVSVQERGKRVTFGNGVTVRYMPPAELVTESGRAGDVPTMEPQ